MSKLLLDNPVAELAIVVLVLSALTALRAWGARWRRRLVTGAALLAVFVVGANVRAEDLSSSVQITRGRLALNRISNTFDATVTVRNTSAVPLLGPLKLALASSTPAHVALYNSHGRLPSTADYVVLPLDNGTLAPGASTSQVVRLITGGQPVAATNFAVDGARLVPGQTATLDIQAVFPAGYAGATEVPVGAGFKVSVNSAVRGSTDAAGRLQVVVPAGPAEISVQRPPNEGGTGLAGALTAGSVTPLKVVVDDGKEFAAGSRLRLDAAQQGVLSRAAPRVALRFMDEREQAVRLAVLYDVTVLDVWGNLKPLTTHFSLQPDGSASAATSAFLQGVAGITGLLQLRLTGEDANGVVHDGRVDVHLADYRVRVQLVAPPSNPGLPLTGVRVTAKLLDTNLLFHAQADASGLATLPDLPRGNLSLTAVTSAGSVIYNGIGTVALGYDAVVRLTMRAPQDMLDSVPPITMQPLPAGIALGAPPKSNTALSAVTPAGADAQRLRSHALRQGLGRRHAPPASAQPEFAYVNVSAAEQDVVVERSAMLTVPKGTKKANPALCSEHRRVPFVCAEPERL